jgi:histidinol-phosphatase (PHP family)
MVVRAAAPARRGKEAAAVIADYHVHTRFSDGRGDVAQLVERAAALGLPEVGITDHLVPVILSDGGDYGIRAERIREYVAAVHRAAREFPQVRVLLGAEIDYVPGAEAEIAATLAAWPFDYVLGSAHYVTGFGFLDLEDGVNGRWPNVAAVFRGYYGAIADLAALGCVDVIAHLDLPKLWGTRPQEDVSVAEDAALEAIAAAGLAIEVNTAGLRRPVAEMYPAAGLLQRACRLGVPLTFGSDAHAPDQVGASFAEAAQLARAAGYRSWLRLSDRRAVPLA